MDLEKLLTAREAALDSQEHIMLLKLTATLRRYSEHLPEIRQLEALISQLPLPGQHKETDAVLAIVECLGKNRGKSIVLRQLHKELREDLFMGVKRGTGGSQVPHYLNDELVQGLTRSNTRFFGRLRRLLGWQT